MYFPAFGIRKQTENLPLFLQKFQKNVKKNFHKKSAWVISAAPMLYQIKETPHIKYVNQYVVPIGLNSHSPVVAILRRDQMDKIQS